jgi:hypothetical protein
MVERIAIRPANRVLAGLIAAFGVVFFVVTVRSGEADSALLFVVLPTALAAALALTPGQTTHGRVFRLTTIGLLLAAVALHEGAICVVLAAPLVYAIAHGVTGLLRLAARGRSRTLAVLPVPLLLFGAVEGSAPHWRVHPDQAVEVVRVVPLDPAAVRDLLAAGPQPVATRVMALRLLDVPTPEHVHGGGLNPGDRWTFGYHGSSHGPGGQIVTAVRSGGPTELTFTVLEDSAITGRWVHLHDASLTWASVGTGRTAVRLRISYRRGLDPSWYFGPLQDRLMHAGAEHLLDMLALR